MQPQNWQGLFGCLFLPALLGFGFLTFAHGGNGPDDRFNYRAVLKQGGH